MFSSLERENTKKRMEATDLDVIIIGGGITGAGIALDAVTRGMRVALFEMQDFSAGTSSRSTKLIHGGLRYLKQFEIGIVAETGKERAIVYENGPHVTTPEWMMLPFYKGGTFGPFLTNIGLRMYDFLAGVKKSERRKMLSPEEALKREPLLNAENLKGAGFYVEYKTDDARLTIEVLKKAVDEGALALNYMEVNKLIYENNRVVGVEVEDRIDGSIHSYYAKKIINATGPWVDTIRELDDSKKGKHLRLTKGVHLVFDGKRFPLQQAIYFDTPDGRMIFAIPRDGKTYVGTTDTDYSGDIANPRVTKEDRDYILKAIDYMFPQVAIHPEDVESSWAGLRPLIWEEGKAPSEISRKDEIFVSDSGLVSIAGGKLTGYRKMAESIVDLVAEQLSEEEGVSFPKTKTKDLQISGGDVGGSAGFPRFIEEKIEVGRKLGLKEDVARQLVQRYGSNVDVIFSMYEEESRNSEGEGNPVVRALLRYAMEYESAYKPTDFFIRRTGTLLFDIDWVHEHKDEAMTYMCEALQWSEGQKAEYAEELERELFEAAHVVEE